MSVVESFNLRDLTVAAADERFKVVGLIALRAICLRRVSSFAQLC